MANVLDSTKSTLGRLLAAEDIRIEHRQVRGPSFDVKDRVLVLPIWKDMDADLYDLMIGHEVGHALFTPAQGWVEQVKEYGKEFKTMLNLVEDARIEKKMKVKYPGLRRPMYNGYTQLVDRGFFGVTMADMKHLPFADRLNVYFKLGARAEISFSDKEQDLVDRIEAVESFEDVMKLAKELHTMAGDEKSELDDIFEDLMDALENDTPGEGGEGEASDEGESIQDTINRLREAGKHKMADALEQASEKAKERLKEWMDRDDTSSITAEAMEKNQEKLIDDMAYPLTYTHFPNIKIENYVVPFQRVHDMMVFDESFENRRMEIYNKFMNANKKYISHMVREFELRRNAKQFARAKTSKTGELDMNRIWSHKISENLFLQTTTVPDGKNHGMVMLIDMSSSMVDCISDTIEQLVSLVMFCRKVNIPFDVYGFFDTAGVQDEFDNYNTMVHFREDRTPGALNTNNNHFRLKQFFHASMKTNQFNRAIQNLLMVAWLYRHTYGRYYWNSSNSHRIPKNMDLGATPLNESILVLNKVAQKFREDYRVEILNTIILTDGQASNGLSRWGVDPDRPEKGYGSQSLGRRVVLEDKKTRHQILCSNGYYRGYTNQLLEMYKHLTGSRVIGIYLMGGRNYKYQVTSQMNMNEVDNAGFEKQWKEEFLKHRYFGVKMQGYDVYYMVPGQELAIEEMDMDKALTEVNTSRNGLLKAFKKMQNTKMVSRVFLNQFVKHVA